MLNLGEFNGFCQLYNIDTAYELAFLPSPYLEGDSGVSHLSFHWLNQVSSWSSMGLTVSTFHDHVRCYRQKLGFQSSARHQWHGVWTSLQCIPWCGSSGIIPFWSPAGSFKGVIPVSLTYVSCTYSLICSRNWQCMGQCLFSTADFISGVIPFTRHDSELVALFLCPQVDLFVSSRSHRLPLYLLWTE